MRRGPTGSFRNTETTGESVRAFLPHPLPPAPPLDLSGPLQRQLERAHLAIGRLDSISTLLPNPQLFLFTYIRKEALLSSQIEGTQSSLSELLLFEIGESLGGRDRDVTDVSNYVAALEHGIARLRGGFPLSNRLICEIHEQLLSRGRGSDKDPGHFRRSQNWIGGTRPGNAAFVPPPPEFVVEHMSELEKFLRQTDDGLPTLVRAALAHVQFETIHPFLDGNGRVGRLLITLLLCHAKALQEPLLYSSLYFKQHRHEYYRLLDAVRTEGDWESWLSFFLDGVAMTADSAVSTVHRLVALWNQDRARIEQLGREAGSVLRVQEALKSRPVQTVTSLMKQTSLTFPTVNKNLDRMTQLGMVRELTGKQRNRLFAYGAYLDILNEGTENL
jgi:Fic family protein